MKSILITGGAGFVGSSLCLALKLKYPSYKIYAFDNLKRRGSELNIKRLKEAGIDFLHGDIRSKEDFADLPEIDTIIEASAEPSVLAGLNSSPDYLINTNLFGTVNCLNFARERKCDVIFLSTSRVYSIEAINGIKFEEQETRFAIAEMQDLPGISKNGISEFFPTSGYRSLYGTTKLASELLIQEYNQFYGVKAVVNRCGVLTGPWQMGKVDQGVVVLWLARHFWKGKLTYNGYGGKGKQVRDMLHVNDLFNLVDFELHNWAFVNGKVYNVGGGNQVSASLLEMTAICEQITGNKIEIQSVLEDRAADIRIYVTDNSLVQKETGWLPKIGINNIFAELYQWIEENEQTLKPILQ